MWHLYFPKKGETRTSSGPIKYLLLSIINVIIENLSTGFTYFGMNRINGQTTIIIMVNAHHVISKSNLAPVSNELMG